MGLHGLCGENRTHTISGVDLAVIRPQFVKLAVDLRKDNGLLNEFTTGFHRNPMKPY